MMQVGFFTVVRSDPQHYLHAVSLVKDVQRVMRDVATVQFTDLRTPIVTGVSVVQRSEPGPMLERRLEHYRDAASGSDWLFVDTDVSLRADVRHVFDDRGFDVALTDRQWAHLPQEAEVMHTMPFNTGVAWSRYSAFWAEVLRVWRAFPETERDWLSEQRAVYAVVRSGQFKVKILPGMVYNYPPRSATDTTPAQVYHYKGPQRKAWLTAYAYRQLCEANVEALACV